jgi:hypothetical protein
MTGQNMPDPLRAIYDPLWQDVVWVNTKWEQFLNLYGDQAAVALLNDTAPAFFHICQDVLWDEVLMSICRLTDPSRAGNRENLTIRRLIDNVDEITYPVLKTQVEAEFLASERFFEPARQHRNRRIAHVDLPTRVNSHPTPLSGVNKRDVDEALMAVGRIMNAIEGHFSDSETAYGGAIMQGGSETLLYWLRQGRENSRRGSRTGTV